MGLIKHSRIKGYTAIPMSICILQSCWTKASVLTLVAMRGRGLGALSPPGEVAGRAVPDLDPGHAAQEQL